MSNSWKARVLTLFTVCVLVILPFSAVPAMAQATTGTMRGTVADPNGGVIAGATVTAKNEATGTVTPTTTTTSEGTFEFSGLPPGPYTVTAEATGFKRSVSTGVQVRAGIVNPVNLAMEAGNVEETITVVANTEEVIQRDQSQISHTVDTRRVEELPSNAAGSGLDTLALLAPGVIPNNSGGVNTNGTGLSVNGNRARSNNFQIDGADNNDLSVAGPAMFFDNQDAVQEIQVITNNFSAQYGRNQGAIVNYVTKAGTNEFHGTAFEFHRDNKNLNSLNNIEKRSGQTEPNQSLFNVFGGTVGGPLYLPRFGEGGPSVLSGKDRAFFFLSYQGIRNPSTSTARSTTFAFLPSEFAHLQAAFPGNAVIQAITTQSTFALRSNARIRSGTSAVPITLGGQTFLVAQPEYDISTPFTETDYSVRFDGRPSKKDNLTVRYEFQKQNFVNILPFFGLDTNGFSGDLPSSSKNFGGIWTRTFSNTVVSETRAFYQKIGVEFGGGCNASDPGCIPSPIEIGSTSTSITFPTISGRSLQGIGPANIFPQGRIGKVYQIAENLSWSTGKHNFIFGGEYKHLSEISPFLPNFNGAFGYNSATRILNNAPSSFSLAVGDPTLAFTENDQYYFIQDDWKVRSNLTLNLGLRYEYTGQPINILHDISVERENSSARFYNSALPISVRTVPEIPADKNNFAPRVGFAWSPNFWKGFLGEDATVVRGGFSIAYEPAFFNILGNVQGSAPFSASLTLGANLLPATGNPIPLPGGSLSGERIRSVAASSGVLPLGQLDPRFLTQTQVSPDFHSPFSEQWSLGVQHQFGRNNVAEVRYVGTRGVDLFQNVNGNFFIGPLVNGLPNWLGTGIDLPSFANLLPPGTTAQHCVNNPATFPNEGACDQRLRPQAGITIRTNDAFSNYHALQSRYNGRFLNNALTLGAAYTWSKTIDNACEIFALDIASANAQNPFCITTCERGISQIDRPHAFSLNFLYDVPFMREQKGFLGHVLGGWQVNGVYVLTSGQPYTPGQFFNSLYGLGNTYLTSGDRPFLANPNADPNRVGISQLDAALLYGVDIENINGFYLINALNSTGEAIPVTTNDVKYIVNLPGSARIFHTPFGSAGRNIERGPALNQLNASLFKNIKVGERVTVQLRGEAYNVLNHPNPGYGVNGVSTVIPDIFVEDAGVEGANFADKGDMTLARRIIQVGIRIIF